jgi:hypothetical protein
MVAELDFLRKLEQDLQHLHERVRQGYSGVPEVTVIKAEINQRIIDLLELRQASN